MKILSLGFIGIIINTIWITFLSPWLILLYVFFILYYGPNEFDLERSVQNE